MFLLSQWKWLSLSLLILVLGVLYALYSEPEQESGQPSLSKSPARRVEEKTPTPCRKTYPEEDIHAAASTHIEGITSGHEKPHFLLMMGGSGSGKSTLLRHVQKSDLNISEFVYHGLDEYLQYLPEYLQTISDPNAVYKDAADECYGGGAIPIAKIAQQKIIQNRIHTIYEETGKNLKRILERVLPPFEAAGYRITMVLIGNYAEIAIIRAAARFLKEGRYAPDDYIQGTFKDNLENYKKLLESGRIHEAVYCDNSCMGKASSFEEAAKTNGCLKCWRDTVVVSSSSAADGAVLIPDRSLSSGRPQYLEPRPV